MGSGVAVTVTVPALGASSEYRRTYVSKLNVPSTDMPQLIWNALTAAVVFAPYAPSAEPERYPSEISLRCICFTAEPSDPLFNTPVKSGVELLAMLELLSF